MAQLDQQLGRSHQILRIEHPQRQRNILLEPLVELEPADRAEIITAFIEEKPLDQKFRIVDVRRIAGPHAAVDLFEGVLLVPGRILAQTADQVVVPFDDVDQFPPP